MRHRVAHRKLGRVTEHRMALLRNQAQALLRHERISTTVAKAKELRPFVERIITVAKRGIADGPEGIRVLNARRAVGRDLSDKEVARKLFDTIAPRFAARQGGYTRLLRIGRRQGDQVEIAYVELVGSEYSPDSKIDSSTADEPVAEKAGVAGRLRKAAQRIRGGGGKKAKKEKDADSSSDPTPTDD
jgi:large subunit ribosomal protein L17